MQYEYEMKKTSLNKKIFNPIYVNILFLGGRMGVNGLRLIFAINGRVEVLVERVVPLYKHMHVNIEVVV